MKINILALLVLVSGVFFFRNFLISKLIGDNITHDRQRYSEMNAVSLIDVSFSCYNAIQCMLRTDSKWFKPLIVFEI